MNFLANKPFVFRADRYEEWFAQRCISQGPIDVTIQTTILNGAIRFNVDGLGSIRMRPEVIYPFVSDSGPSVDLGKRLQYVNAGYGEDPLFPLVCQVFYEDRTISYIRFGMSYPDRIIEFYGKTVEFEGIARPDIVPGRRLPSFKGAFGDEIAALYRLLLKENTVTPAIIDHQMACVAFSLKKYYPLIAMIEDQDGTLQSQVFKDVSSFISQFYPIFGNEALDIARDWFYQIAENSDKTEAFLSYYYTQLKAGKPVDSLMIQHKLQLK